MKKLLFTTAFLLGSTALAFANYGALATSIWRDSDGAHVRVGTANNYESQSAADEVAIQQCINRGGVNCTVKGQWKNGGCGFVSVGHRGSKVAEGHGPTAERAVANCESENVDCKPAIGGCSD